VHNNHYYRKRPLKVTVTLSGGPIFFSNGCRLNKNYVLPNIIFDNVSIPYVDQTKLLRVIIDKNSFLIYIPLIFVKKLALRSEL
jgi:hypothetical protein